MLYQKTIRKFIALAMLVVFAFSITPQKSIHDVVAKHIDPTNCSVHKDLPIEQIEKDCDRDNFMDSKQALKYGLIDKIINNEA